MRCRGAAAKERGSPCRACRNETTEDETHLGVTRRQRLACVAPVTVRASGPGTDEVRAQPYRLSVPSFTTERK